jgi:hypothetical protein
MRRRTWIPLLIVALSAIFALQALGMSAKSSMTMSGVLIDTKCYSMNKANKGNDHMTSHGEMAACGTACAKLGFPVGLLRSNGAVVILVGPSTSFADHIGAAARVTGVRVLGMTNAVRPSKVEVKDANGHWVAVEMANME